MKNHIIIPLILCVILTSCNTPQKPKVTSSVSIKNSDSTFFNSHLLDEHKKIKEAAQWLDTLKTRYSTILTTKQKRFDSIESTLDFKVICGQNRELNFLRIRHSNEVAKLNKAYDRTYTNLIAELDEALKITTDSMTHLGKEKWYSQIGSTYYHEMIKKYKRK